MPSENGLNLVKPHLWPPKGRGVFGGTDQARPATPVKPVKPKVAGFSGKIGSPGFLKPSRTPFVAVITAPTAPGIGP